jgi:hypothetical protein
MPHLVLLGDSIFDNAVYVPGRQPVIEQVRAALPRDWHATLLAVDGHRTRDVPRQLTRLPADASHLLVSVGGNDGLAASWILGQRVSSVSGALELLHNARETFRDEYRQMLNALKRSKRPAAVCTVYDSVPGLGPAESAALAAFNEVILREAFAARLPVIDLRLICNNPSHYSPVSPIEPSAEGGAKISRMIAELVTTHDFTLGRSAIYA